MNKKEVEAWVLAEARRAGVPIPIGEYQGESPDFRFGSDAGFLGIEASEIMRPANSNNGIMPLEEENYHNEITALAEKAYNGTPAHVSVYFADSRGQRRDKRAMARALTDFVQAKVVAANPFASFGAFDGVPEGFFSVTIMTDRSRPWWSGECGGYELRHIRQELAFRIEEKNKLLSSYRVNLPPRRFGYCCTACRAFRVRWKFRTP